MKRTIRLTLGVICMLFAGIIYAWSILKAPLAQEFSWSASQLALNFTLTMCFFCIGGMVSGFTIKKVGPKVLIVLSAFISGLGFIITSKNPGNLQSLYLSYGVMCGFGIGVAYNALLACTNAWFPDKKGLCSGCLMMGFGASTLVIGNIAGRMMESSSYGWRKTYFLLGIALMFVLAVSGLYAAFPAQDVKAEKTDETASEDSENEYTPVRMLKSFTFWKFYLFTISMAAIGNVVISVTKDIALSLGAQAALATSLVGTLSICNGLGRLISGALFDSLGRKKTMLIGGVVTLLAPCALLFAALSNNLIIGIIGLILCGLSYGFSPSISSAVTSSFFGQKNFAMNFAITNTMLIPTSFIATLVGSMITKSGSFISTYVLLIAFAVVSLVLNLSIKKP